MDDILKEFDVDEDGIEDLMDGLKDMLNKQEAKFEKYLGEINAFIADYEAE